MKHVKTKFNVLVIGGGHAGIEAALAVDRLGLSVGLITMDRRAIGRMSCNPAIGGLAKGQMVREIDVLGGIMGFAADNTGLQFKMLNKSKGKSVWSPRAQVDKRRYESFVKDAVLSSGNISVIEGEAVKLCIDHYRVCGILLRNNITVQAEAVILTCGTFLNGLIHMGDRKIRAGRAGENGSSGITEYLVSLGFVAGRLKTGTPPRLVSGSINWNKMSPSEGDEYPTPFSYQTETFSPPNIPCYTTRTNPLCHEVIYKNLKTSPMFSGDVSAAGPRYCPSIEDKIHRFPHRDNHTLFFEPEWRGSNQIYTNGFSTSLPDRVQLEALRKIDGLERVEFFRPGYAIEYDFFPSSQLKSSLETKNIEGLFCAGQINGTSGYEEAAAQGLLAGVNASLLLLNKPPLLLGREEAYIGVLIDDLVTKETLEPYRMFTSRAEYRLLLRFSNAGKRLSDKAFSYGLLSREQYETIHNYFELCGQITSALNRVVLPEEINPLLISKKEKPIPAAFRAKDLIKRPNITINNIPGRIFNDLCKNGYPDFFINEMMLEAETKIKYSGYINRQQTHIEKLAKQETLKIPLDFNYMDIKSISKEAKEKLSFIRPETLGQAMRVSGVTPSDASVLSVFLSR